MNFVVVRLFDLIFFGEEVIAGIHRSVSCINIKVMWRELEEDTGPMGHHRT